MAKLDATNYAKVSFDMGTPIKIVDLAKALISIIHGEDHNIAKIVFSKLSKGEKLHETVTSENETLIKSEIDNIFYI